MDAATRLQHIEDILTQHLADDKVKFEALQETLNKIDAKLEPISNTYKTVGTLGSWLMPLLVALSLVAGTIWAVVEIFLNVSIVFVHKGK